MKGDGVTFTRTCPDDGWYFPEPSLHLQAVSESHRDYEADDNLGCHWADPGLGLRWSDPEPILSPRCAGLGTLDALLGELDGQSPASRRSSARTPTTSTPSAAVVRGGGPPARWVTKARSSRRRAGSSG